MQNAPVLQEPDKRKGIESGIQMIWQFISKGRSVPGDGRAFFDKSKKVEYCRYGYRSGGYLLKPPFYMAMGRRAKRNGGSENQSRRILEMARENTSALRRLFFFCRRPADYFLWVRAKNQS